LYLLIIQAQSCLQPTTAAGGLPTTENKYINTAEDSTTQRDLEACVAVEQQLDAGQHTLRKDVSAVMHAEVHST
jgi:hypothetical protein